MFEVLFPWKRLNKICKLFSYYVHYRVFRVTYTWIFINLKQCSTFIKRIKRILSINVLTSEKLQWLIRTNYSEILSSYKNCCFIVCLFHFQLSHLMIDHLISSILNIKMEISLEFQLLHLRIPYKQMCESL